MKLDQIRAFIAVVETGSFRSAAEAIHKAQPSISTAVRTLEEQYNISLFDRNSYRPTLTAEGKAFFQQSKKLMNQVQQLEHLGHDLAQGTEQPLRVCLSQMVLSPECMARIQHFQSENPHINLDLTTQHLFSVQEQLLKDKAEIAIGPHYGLDDRHVFIELMKIQMITVVTPDLLSKLQGTTKQVKQQTLYSLPQILVATTTSPQESGHRVVLPAGKRWYINDFLAKKTLLLNGLGWSRIPSHMIQDELTSGQLMPMEVENFTSQSTLPIFMIRLRGQTLSHHANQFWEAMKEFSLK